MIEPCPASAYSPLGPRKRPPSFIPLAKVLGKSEAQRVGEYLSRVRVGIAEPLDEFLQQNIQPQNRSTWEEKVYASDDYFMAEQLGLVEERFKTRQKFDDFRILRKLGTGGMGTVWEAEQISIPRRVALKLFTRTVTQNRNGIRSFKREAEAAGRLSHPNIVRIYGVGEHRGVAFIAQELVSDGRTLADYLTEARKEPQLSENYYLMIAELFRQVAVALHSAHQAGVIHRDIKPGNILLDENMTPRIADFGLAKLEDDPNMSVTANLAGTLRYMSPEQAAHPRIGLDARTDAFSYGATLFEALTLTQAFNGDTREQVLRDIITKEVPDARTLRSKVPRELAIICAKCLEKNREHRYADMEAVAADLERYLKNEDIVARPSSVWIRMIKWRRRHPLISTITLVVAGAFLIILVLLGWIAQSNRELKLERQKFLQLRDSRVLDHLVSRAERLVPAFPNAIDEYEKWLLASARVSASAPTHEAILDDIRDTIDTKTEVLDLELRKIDLRLARERLNRLQAEAFSERKIREARAKVLDLQEQIEDLEERVMLAGYGDFIDDEGEYLWLLGQTNTLVNALKEHNGSSGWHAIVEQRLASARRLQALEENPTYQSAWRRAQDSIASEDECPDYRGRRLPRQTGLRPIRKDPCSGLWEFLVVETGEMPVIDPTSQSIVPTPEMGVVMVLVPPGSFSMGTPSDDAALLAYQQFVPVIETPAHRVIGMEWFFVSKYELTVAQWMRLTGEDHTTLREFRALETIYEPDPLHPVFEVSWHAGQRVLRVLGLDYPTEAQWEYAARGGTDTLWWNGNEIQEVDRIANIADASLLPVAKQLGFKVNPNLDDGHDLYAPVGSYLANPYGLYDVYGNVMEWARDNWEEYPEDGRPLEDPEGLRTRGPTGKYIRRGGSFRNQPLRARSGFRMQPTRSSDSDYNIGLRPARRVHSQESE